MTEPKVIATIGPIRGETNMDATTIVEELIANPVADSEAATTWGYGWG